MQRLTAKYAPIQGSYWMGLAVLLGYASPYLLANGFTNGQIGILIAAAGLVTAFLQPVTAAWADDPDKPSPWHISLALSGGIIICSLGLLLGRGLGFIGVAYALCIVLLQTIQPLMNSLGVSERINFGLARGIGSVAYAVIAFLLSRLISAAGSRVIPAAVILCFLIFALSVVRYPLRHPETARAASGRGAGSIEFIRKYPRFCVMLIGCVFTYISHVLLSNFTFQIVQSKGGLGMEMGTVTAIAALVELPTMFLFAHLRRRAGCDTWLRVSGIFFFLRAFASFLCRSVIALYAVQAFQMLGWALMAVNSVYYADCVIAPEDAVKGQAYFTLSYTAASVVGNVIGGALLDRSGAGTMLLFGAVCAGIGALILFFSAEAGKQN